MAIKKIRKNVKKYVIDPFWSGLKMLSERKVKVFMHGFDIYQFSHYPDVFSFSFLVIIDGHLCGPRVSKASKAHKT